MRQRKRKVKKGSAANRPTGYRILLFKDVEHVPVQMKVTFTKLRLMAVAGFVIVFLLLALGFGFFLNARLFRESESARFQLFNSSERQMQKMKRENEELKETLRLKDEQLQEVQELQELADATRQKLEDIQQREVEVRSRLGLEESVPEEESAEAETVQNQSSISPNTIPMIRQSYSSLQDELDNKLSDYSGFSEMITKNEQAEKKAADRRAAVVAYALQFVGGRYVYGGNDPNKGVDCSGFTKYVLYHSAGIGLNRTAAAQSGQGTTVSMSQARPGDLVFYRNGDSGINHVALYIGDGRVVHASTEKTGIITSRWDYRTPAKIQNVLGP